MLYNGVLVSAVQQSESAIRIHISPLFWISFPFRSPQSTEFPVLYSRSSLVIWFIHSIKSVHMSVPISQFIPPPPFPLGIHTCVLYVCISISAYYSAIKRNKIGSFVETWMDLETVIQSEVSQKEKNKYRILTRICGI